MKQLYLHQYTTIGLLAALLGGAGGLAVIQVQAQTNAVVIKSYAELIQFDKPLAYYRFEETSGSVVTNSGSTGGNAVYSVGDEASPGAGGSPGSASGAPGPRPPQFPGFDANNHAASFDGSSTWVDTKNQFLQGLGAFTLEYWVAPTNRSSWANRVGIVGQNDAVEYGFIDPNTIQIWTPNGGSLNTAYSFPDGEWHHVATIADGQTIKTYYDGKLVGTGGSATTAYGTSTFFVHIGGGGVYDPTGNWFTGLIDEVAIFDKAIPADRIAEHYTAAKTGVIVVPVIDNPVSSINGFKINVHDVETHVMDTNTLTLSFDGTKVTPTALTKTNGVATITYNVPNPPLASGSTHTTSTSIKDTAGALYSSDATFTVITYATLATNIIVTPDTTKPGFLWEMSQVDSVGSDAQNSNKRTMDQLAGLLGPNVADPSAQGIALGPGKPESSLNLPIDFEIPTVINLSINAPANNGNFTPDDQMPGAPGTNGGTDNQAARVVTYVDLPQGMVTMGVNSDDGFLTGAGFWNDAFTTQVLGQFDGGRGAADTIFSFFVPKAGVYPIFTIWENGGGGSNIELFSVKPDGTKVLLNDSTNGGFKAYRAITGGTKNVAVGQSVTPLPGATGVDPSPTIMVQLADGATPIDKSTVSLKLDDVAVPATITKSSNVTTIVYAPTNILASLSTHTAALTYTEAGTPVTRPWQFTVSKYSGYAVDSVKGYVGFLLGNAVPTADAAGPSGKAGDKAVDLGSAGNAWIKIVNPGFLNAAASNDVMTFSIWVKKYDIANGSAFWADSPTAGRAFQAHTPWSDDTIYFDTAGCCDTSAQRISANINTFSDYTGNDGWWTNWHHFVFLKNAADKQIWIDGKQFLDGSSTDPLPTDINGLGLGTDGVPGADFMHGQLDDFAVFSSAVTAANIGLLAKGTAPTALTGEKLMAYWSFDNVTSSTSTNPPPPVTGGPHIDKITVSGTNLSITWTGGGSLQQTTALGPGATWTDVSGATSSPATLPIGSNKDLFIRVKK